MAKQLRVIRRKHKRRSIKNRGESLDLRHALLKKMGGMRIGCLNGGIAVINLFAARAAGDAIIFDAGEDAFVGSGQIGLEIIEIQIEGDVAVEIAVARVAGIALVAAPDLFGGIEVAAKGGKAIGGQNGRKDGVTMPRL